jgi:enoyl-CoA hydratase/carnithine racemase
MTNEIVLVEVVERVATVTLNRPEARNALNAELLDTIRERLRECDASEDVDVMVLTGADPAFCAGLDLEYLASRMQRESDGTPVVFPDHPVPAHGKPIIGAINGAAVTGGLELALGCDFLVASENARFADTHARVGVVPGWRLTVELPEAIGYRRAKEMSTTGNFVDAQTALEWGLVNHVVPHQELLPFCRKLGADIVSNDAATARAILTTYNDERETVDGPRAAIELERFREWHESGKGVDADIEHRRDAVMARGREQAR